MKWFDKNFHTYNYFLRNKFLEKTIKVSLDGGFTCPNRDGTLSTHGCVFCSNKGSGDFSGDRNLNIEEQFLSVRNSMKKKWPNAKYIAYFQAYTNTYANVDTLREKYLKALSLENVVGISIATRPDCLDIKVLDLLYELSKKTFVSVELGFQTSKKESIKFINRCYENDVYLEAVKKLKDINVNVVAHCILGLPNETKQDMQNTVKFVCNSNIDGIKLQLLYILENTSLGEIYKKENFKLLSFNEYIDIVVSLIEIIPQNIVIHRLTGDPKKEDLIAPIFSLKKFHILNEIDKELIKRNTWQGKYL